MERIMIIDSDIDQMRELNGGLSGDYRILNCSRGAQAMELFKLYLPSAVVLDPATPDLNTRDFIRQVRGLPSGWRQPILALTRISRLRHIEESFEWGVDIIFSKPCSGQRIKKKLSEYLVSAERNIELAGVE